MPKINLLPSDLTPKKSVLRIGEILTKVIYTGIAIFLVFVLTLLGIFLVDYTKIKNLNSQKDALAESVQKYQQTEQQIVLAKDRMNKISEIWKVQNTTKNLEVFENFISLISSDISLKEADLSSSKSEITVESKSSSGVATFMGNLVTSDLYKTIRLTNFSFNPSYGYRISFEGYLN